MMKFRQFNMQHCKLAHENLIHEIVETSDICFLQEPYNFKGKICGLPPSYRAYSCHNSRAAIIAPKNINLWFNPEFSTKDISVCLLKTNKQKVFLISAYLDINIDPVSILEKVVNFLTLSDTRVIIAMDANSHSPMWGGDETNPRGEILESFLMSKNLTICNLGNKKTFVSKNGSSIIDVTCTSSHKDVKIYNWHVSDEHRFSDHKCIFFEADFSCPKFKPIPNILKCNWDNFRNSLPKNQVSYDPWSYETIEIECNNITSCIRQALKKSCPLTKPGKSSSWWSSELEQQSVAVKKLAKKAWASKNEADFANLKAATKNFTKNVRKAKRSRWHLYCEATQTPQQMARLSKALFRKEDNCLNLLRYPNESYTRTPEDVSNLLFETHFPDSQSDWSEMANDIPRGTTCTEMDLRDHFITEHMVKKAFESFGSLKSAGPDNIKPIALQQLNENMISRITRLYKACIKLGYTPKSWRNSKIVFIPKAGKDDYTKAKSFRPISLTSFLFKGLERVVLWHLEETTLLENPLSKNQHAYRKGYSCESALSSMVDMIESAILRPPNIALGAFLDVEGAFNHAHPLSITKAMIDKNFPVEIRLWYTHYQSNRLAETELLGFKSSRKLVKGIAQGGVLSSLMWNIIFDSFLNQINQSGPVKAIGYADDGALLTVGKDPSIMVSNMQKAINTAVDWGAQNGLSFNQQKTECIWFYRKYKWKDPQEKVKMNGMPIEYTNQVKYLGIILDSKLSWKQHMRHKVNKAKRHLMAFKNAFGILWGPSPRMLKWAFNGIIVPALLYGAVVWARVCAQKTIQSQLGKLNRLICLLMMPLRKGTPTSGLEVILNIFPLDLKAEEAALKGYLRVNNKIRPQWDGIGNGKVRGHLWWWNHELQKIGVDQVHDREKFLILEKLYFVDLDSKSSGLPSYDSTIACYTDGSKINDRSGYGVSITKNDHEITSTFGALGKKTTVYQAEVYAIHKCCELLIDMEPESVTIFTDNQSALESLAQVNGRSKVVQNCISILNRLAKTRPVTLKWIKAHSNHTGNECADALAKKGTTIDQMETLSPPFSYATKIIKMHLVNQWNLRWITSDKCRQTKIWFPNINQKHSGNLMKLNRYSLGLIVQGLTGFNRLMAHENIVDPNTDPTCRLCQGKKIVESFWHIIGECPALHTLRLNIFHTYFTLDTSEWKVYQILNFVETPQIRDLMKGL